MKRETALFTKTGAPSAAFKELYKVAKACTLTTTRIPVCVLFLKTFGGRGRYTHLNDAAYYNAQDVLRLLGVAFSTGNAAPRGGANGDYLLINAGVFFDAVNKELTARNLALTDME